MRGVAELLKLTLRQWRSPEAVEHFRDRRLRRLVRHAWDTVPFYRRLFENAAVRPDDISSVNDLARIPMVTRTMIQDRPWDDVLARGTDRSICFSSRTSGSTGTPLEIVCSHSERALYNPAFFRAYLAWGLRPHHRLTYFQARRNRLGSHSWYEAAGVFRRQTLFSLDEPSEWVDSIRSWQPYLVHGYSLTLKLLAEAALKAGIDDVHVPLVVSTSGILDETGRHALETAFGARVADLYASEEAGSVIAWECPTCPGYHLCTDSVIVELLCDGRPARAGEDASVVVTNLNNFTMPFIRYEQGDIVRLSQQQPRCGRCFPLIDSIRGRSGDYIVLPSGRRMTPHPFFLVLDHAVGVGQWQVVQEQVDRIVVRVTASSTDIDTGAIAAGIRRVVQEEVSISVSIVERIRRDPAAKLRSVISDLPEAATSI